LEYDRLKNLILDAENIDLEGWIISSFTTRPSNSGGQNGVFTSSVHRLRHIASNLTLTSLGRMMR
jgi:protein subunit release factor B